MCMLMKNLSGPMWGRLPPPNCVSEHDTTKERAEEVICLGKCVYCSNFSTLLTFLLPAPGRMAWFTTIDWGDMASPIMSQKKEQILLCLAINIFPFSPTISALLFMCICIGLIKVMEKHESGWERCCARFMEENTNMDSLR